ncbi:hypothetical protein OROGR_007458 [Orobanche gracilis]
MARHTQHKEVVEVPETIHNWKDQWFFIGGEWWSTDDGDCGSDILNGRLRDPEHFISKIHDHPARGSSKEYDERVDKLMELLAEQRKSYLLTTEANVWAAGLRFTDPNMSELVYKGGPSKKETPTQRVERLADERAERMKWSGAKCKRDGADAEISATRAAVGPISDQVLVPSPIRTGRAAGKELVVDLRGHYLPPNKDREGPCDSMKGRRQGRFLFFVHAATPTTEMMERVLGICPRMPLRGKESGA